MIIKCRANKSNVWLEAFIAHKKEKNIYIAETEDMLHYLWFESYQLVPYQDVSRKNCTVRQFASRAMPKDRGAVHAVRCLYFVTCIVYCIAFSHFEKHKQNIKLRCSGSYLICEFLQNVYL